MARFQNGIYNTKQKNCGHLEELIEIILSSTFVTPKQISRTAYGRCASDLNARTIKLNSKFYCPNSFGVNVFAYDWKHELN